jgi:hypothetical protein
MNPAVRPDTDRLCATAANVSMGHVWTAEADGDQASPAHYDRAVFLFGELVIPPMDCPAIQPIKPENGIGARGAKTRRPMPESGSRKSGYGPNQIGMLSMA